MAGEKYNFVTDIRPPIQRGMLWPMKSGALMSFREVDIYAVPPIRGVIEGGVSQGCIFTWNTDGTCNNGDYSFQLKTPEEREAANQPKKTEPTYSYDSYD